jgi:hypothetical protein
MSLHIGRCEILPKTGAPEIVAIGVARSIGGRLVLGPLPSCVTRRTYACSGIGRIEADNLVFKGHCYSLSLRLPTSRCGSPPGALMRL